MMIEGIKQQIAAQEKQFLRLKEDLDTHTSGRCGCLKYSWFRCEGHKRATLSVMKNVRIIIQDLERSKERLEKAINLDLEGKICSIPSNISEKTPKPLKKAKNTKQK